MLTRQTMVQAAVAAVLCAASAIAQASPTGDRAHDGARDADMAQWHMQMCSDRYARHVGELAYLETKLGLTESQKPLFASWRDAVLATAKTRSDDCLAHRHDGARFAALPDREARLHDRLQARLAALDAQHPSLAALYQSLTPEQKRLFDMPRPGEGGPDGHRPGGSRWHDHDGSQDRDGPPDHGG